MEQVRHDAHDGIFMSPFCPAFFHRACCTALGAAALLLTGVHLVQVPAGECSYTFDTVRV